MAAAAGTEYPDIVGVISKQRISLDVADVAVSVRPGRITAGRPFEALLLVQNNADCEIDAEVRLIVPAKDKKNAPGRFITKSDKRIAVGLRPAEVGYVRFPVMVDQLTAANNDYNLQVEVEIKRQVRTPNRVRSQKGGTSSLNKLPRTVQAVVEPLIALNFAAATSRQTRSGALLNVPFGVQPPGISLLEEPQKADWISLWTPRDLDAETLTTHTRPLTTMAQAQLRRENVFFPLLRATQSRFEQAGIRLWAGEAVAIAKLITILLEGGVPAPSNVEVEIDHPRWFVEMSRLLMDSPDLVKSTGQMVAEPLYFDLIHDATMTGFALMSMLTTENLGTAAEKDEYAEGIIQSLQGRGQPLDIANVYLPLVLGGLLVTDRLVMPREQSLDSAELLVTARIKRENERNADNQMVFDLFDLALDRELGRNDTSLQRYLDPIERLKYKQA